VHLTSYYNYLSFLFTKFIETFLSFLRKNKKMKLFTTGYSRNIFLIRVSIKRNRAFRIELILFFANKEKNEAGR